MSPEEHYKRAEELIGIAEKVAYDSRANYLRQAQVHATLATAPRSSNPTQTRPSSNDYEGPYGYGSQQR